MNLETLEYFELSAGTASFLIFEWETYKAYVHAHIITSHKKKLIYDTNLKKKKEK